MKEIVGKEYKRRVRKILERKLNGNNLVSAINVWTVPVIRYSAPFLTHGVCRMGANPVSCLMSHVRRPGSL